jgi:hypothetical protein
MLIPCLFNQANSQLACILGQPFNVYRTPGDGTVDQTPTLIATTSLKVTPGGDKFAIPRFLNVNYFTIVGDRTKFRPGDIIVPANPLSSTPPITILNYDDALPCIGFRTSRKCSVDMQVGTHVYTNLYFDFLSYTTPESGIIDGLAGALDIPNKKIVCWTRRGYQPQHQPTYEVNEGMRIVESDGTAAITYVVKAISQIGNITIFTVDQEKGIS